ncbi:carbon-nitrogen family hydrolase [Paenibacillus sp. ACRRX]|uniref:carbon-nitrogen family hydrolase n=1 Tax=Paenibacillus sp. ACRRX TaxID=2918206 RepID=UPI001EF7188A|nr:carbon-nitrogen family hydrolase [Paenibacillus sp. ACRRX]MCG7406673.1 carbon-nitrogen family hydrolase [Paenibacillus sp. ACRRX]
MAAQQWHISVIQMDVKIGEPDRNYDEVIQKIEQAVSSDPKPDVIVLPEMWNTGYALERIHEIADENGERTRKLLQELSAMHQVHIVGGSVAIKENDRIKNVAYIYNKEGQLAGEYAKIHLFRLMDEHVYLDAGQQLGRFELDGVQCAVIICYDLRFPELSRSLALQGIEVLFVPAQWPHPRLHHWQTLLTARAIENQMYVIACNRMGSSIGADGNVTSFFGHSTVLDPWGETVAAAGEEDMIITAALSLSLVQEVRGRIPVFQDRKESLYQLSANVQQG